MPHLKNKNYAGQLKIIEKYSQKVKKKLYTIYNVDKQFKLPSPEMYWINGEQQKINIKA